MKKNIIFFAIIFNLLIACTFASQSPSNNIIVFGDSLSDIGNNHWIYALGAPITSYDKQGNKNNWVHYLADKLSKKPAFPSNKAAISPFTDTTFI